MPYPQKAADEASSEEEDDETSPAGAEGREGDGVEEASVQVSKSSEKDKKNRKVRVLTDCCCTKIFVELYYLS